MRIVSCIGFPADRLPLRSLRRSMYYSSSLYSKISWLFLLLPSHNPSPSHSSSSVPIPPRVDSLIAFPVLIPSRKFLQISLMRRHEFLNAIWLHEMLILWLKAVVGVCWFMLMWMLSLNVCIEHSSCKKLLSHHSRQCSHISSSSKNSWRSGSWLHQSDTVSSELIEMAKKILKMSNCG